MNRHAHKRAREERLRTSLRQAAEKFRRAREEAGLTLRELGEKAGLAPSTILKIENSKLVPSLAVCIRLAEALGRPISYFAELDEPPCDLRFTSRGQGRVSEIKGAPIVIEHIAERLVNPRMEGFLIRLGRGAKSGQEVPISYHGEEIVIGLKGRIRFEIRGQEYLLGPGDVLHFKGDIPHFWENAAQTESEMYMICSFSYQR
ncbi:MAG: XRE family transcriptional regulator [Candidatus Binatia bacterium]|nr:XRE family transcriptional regulator [Candidatus Binatia bacterium]